MDRQNHIPYHSYTHYEKKYRVYTIEDLSILLLINEGDRGIISTADSSATGIALLGICLNYNFPLISIVRNPESKKELEESGAKNVIVQLIVILASGLKKRHKS